MTIAKLKINYKAQN